MKFLLVLLIVAVIIVGLFLSTNETETPEPEINALQQWAKRFLERSVPRGMNYVPDSFAERFIREYAANGRLKLDKEMTEVFQLTVLESQNEYKSGTRDEKDYLKESADILLAIQKELETNK